MLTTRISVRVHLVSSYPASPPRHRAMQRLHAWAPGQVRKPSGDEQTASIHGLPPPSWFTSCRGNRGWRETGAWL